jgi:hypothetical protein
MINKIARDYIKSIRIIAPGCSHKEKCVHFYQTLRLDDKFINGEFCIRFETWPEDRIKDICNGNEICTAFMDRDRVSNSYSSAILRGREFKNGIFDLNRIV